ncbi:hypothetical protein PO909_000447 [Leuciscus waleckii]
MTNLLSNLPKKGLVLAHLNICSLRNKVHEIINICSNGIHVLALSETHLDCSFDNSQLAVEGYRLFRKDRNQNGGGVAFYISENIAVTLREDLMGSDIEMIWLQLNIQFKKPILVGCCYRPPSPNVDYLEKICDNIEKAAAQTKDIFLLGDFNIDWFSKKCYLRRKMITITNASNLKQIVTQPTRISLNGKFKSTCIDHIFTNVYELCSHVISVGVGCSDHNLIITTKKTKLPKFGARIVYRRSYKTFDPNAFVEDVERSTWSVVCDEEDVNASLRIFMDRFVKIVDKHAPIRKRSIKGNNAPWLDAELKFIMRERDNAKAETLKSKSDLDERYYCKLRNKVTKLNRLKKKIYFSQKISNSSNNSKQLWKVINEIMCKKTKCSNMYLETAAEIITKPLDIANHLNDFFIKKTTNLRSSMLSYPKDSPCSNVKNIMRNKSCSLTFGTVREEIVEKMLLSLPEEKTAGIDHLDGKIVKTVANILCKPISHIFNRSVISGVFLEIWKQSKIIPVVKDDRLGLTESNCRPINILPILSKIFEKLLFNQMMQYFVSNNLLSNSQHAYKPGHSTNTALVQMVDQWLTFMDDKKLVGAVLLDFTAAFDVIDHDILLSKLKCYGFSHQSVSLICSYLSGRSQRVFFNGSFSDCKQLSCVIPQGSCLGPLLFSVFVNDLSHAVSRADVVLYADDATMFYASPTITDISCTLQNELNAITNWVKLNKLAFNISKTKCIVFGTKRMLGNPCNLNLIIDTSVEEQVSQTKLLGVKLDSQLSWADQIDHIVSKVAKGIALSRRCSVYCPPLVMKTVVQSLVLSHLGYCPVIWSSATQGHLKKLQIVQNRAARVALGCSFRSSVDKMHTCLGWIKVEDKLNISLLCYMHNALFKNNPKSFVDKLVFNGYCHGHVTRQVSSGVLVVPSARSNCMTRTVLVRSSSAWNKLDLRTRQISNICNFKKTLKQITINSITSVNL